MFIKQIGGRNLKLTPKQILNLFFYRKDVFAIQQTNGAYYIVKRPITLTDIQKHLSGEITIGAYCLNTNNKIKWACVDLDGDEKMPTLLLSEAKTIYGLFTDYGRILEFSGRKGYHVWILFNKPIYATIAQHIVKSRLNRLNLLNHEIFPKQCELNEHRKYGNLVKIPYATHRVNKKKSTIIKMGGII